MLSRSFETQVDDWIVQADDLEQLRTAIRGDRRDTHLRDDLVQTLVDRLAIRLRELLGRLVLDLTGADHFIQRRVGKVRIDRRRAVTDQACELMRIARSRGLDDDVDGRSVVQGTGGSVRGDLGGGRVIQTKTTQSTSKTYTIH